MLVGLSIRNVVLIDRLDLTFDSGLSVLTGETGAGKSILLDALGLSLGMRAEAGLVRQEATRPPSPPVSRYRASILSSVSWPIRT
ncbi:AAA family ATPase [Fodinicurvata halophila]|uniref:AAA family ATPase n=1 Tax=Fodinicurvata halophila TaxID=1419723 RepID=UPI00362AD11B